MEDKIDESGLLTRGKIRELRILHSSQYETYELEFCKAQRDLTASIKDAECQERVERVRQEIMSIDCMEDIADIRKAITALVYSLKKQKEVKDERQD